MDIIERIVGVKRDSKDEPVKPITMTVSITYLDEEGLKKILN
jgi:hypothetical protein